ncbi:hypothetical protein I1A62_02985 (plasmid) [Rhodococcus sp. USK10]|uniref:SGNH/GDSL hydrolase family protein n=1 Tax=Rhodococcus sp. USK10 TaxID=2789739 RepID=UPI001C5DC390|nr:hypothetical protein [Rhodococcus sp. USK10]QYB00083.1 hypothetical protein I1A62_02985 [Rhodococcus sp. USK10]
MIFGAIILGFTSEDSKVTPNIATSGRAGVQLGPAPLTVHRRQNGTTFVTIVGDALAAGRGASSFEEGFRRKVVDALRVGGRIDPVVTAPPEAPLSAIVSDAPIPERSSLVIVELGSLERIETQQQEEEFRQRYSDLIARVKVSAPAAPLLCLGAWRDQQDAFIIDAIIYDACSTDQNKFVQLTDIFERAGSRGPAGRPAYLGGGIGDVFYPNDAGHEAIAQRVLDSLSIEG